MMQLRTGKKYMLLAVAAIALGVIPTFSFQNVSAVQGSDDQTTNTPSTTNSPNTSNTVKTESNNKNELERHAQDLKNTAQKEIEQDRKAKKETMAEDKRKLVCENRKNAINNKLAAYTQAADKHLTRLNDTFSKVQAYQTSQSLPVANYDELVATATTKQKAASDAVAALKLVATSVDCTNPDNAVKLGTVKQAAKNARQALLDYRTSIKDIVVALAQANHTSKTENTSTDNDSQGGSR